MILKSYHLVSAVIVSWLLVIPGAYSFYTAHKFPVFLDLFEDETDEISNIEERSINSSDAGFENDTSLVAVTFITKNVSEKTEPKSIEPDITTEAQTEKRENLTHHEKEVEETSKPSSTEGVSEKPNITVKALDNNEKKKEKCNKTATDENVSDFVLQPFKDTDSKVPSDSLQDTSSTGKDYDIKSVAEDGIRFTRLCIRLIASLVQDVMEAYLSVGDATPASPQSPQNVASNIDYDQSPSRKVIKRDAPSTENALGSSSTNKQNVKNETTSEGTTTHADEISSNENSTETSVDPSAKPQSNATNTTLGSSAKTSTSTFKIEPAKTSSAFKDQLTILNSITDSLIFTNRTEFGGKEIPNDFLGKLKESEGENSSMPSLAHAIEKLNDDGDIPELFRSNFGKSYFQPDEAGGDDSEDRDGWPISFTTMALVVGVVWVLGVVVAAGVVAASYKLGYLKFGGTGGVNANPPNQRSTVA